jgi:undecaprenyl phosphate N,N'-diacetylbacillosamine 1-phosphate transferase
MEEKKFQKAIKRLFDIVVSLSVLILLLPLWFVVAILIKSTPEGPIFFLQERPGYHRKIFKVYKFRTMRPGSEKMFKGKEVMKDDDRITTIGKFLRRSKIDEIPQILNVLKGEMSLVGPRPERVASLEDYTDEISKRLNMKPGLTGLAQVSGNIYLSLGDRYKFDVYYVENFSIWLDLKIIIRTVGVILFGEDKYVDKYLVDVKKGVTEVAATKEEICKK